MPNPDAYVDVAAGADLRRWRALPIRQSNLTTLWGSGSSRGWRQGGAGGRRSGGRWALKTTIRSANTGNASPRPEELFQNRFQVVT